MKHPLLNDDETLRADISADELHNFLEPRLLRLCEAFMDIGVREIASMQ